MSINKTSDLRITVKTDLSESGVGDQCLCKPPCSFISHLVIAEVQSGESGIVAGEPEESLSHQVECGSHCPLTEKQKKKISFHDVVGWRQIIFSDELLERITHIKVLS